MAFVQNFPFFTIILALSGGVDSSVTAALISKAVGKQLTCVFVDHGLMRKNEGDFVEKGFYPNTRDESILLDLLDTEFQTKLDIAQSYCLKCNFQVRRL